MAKKGPIEQIAEYAQLHGLTVGGRLGFGVHGSVFVAEYQSNGDVVALKALEREDCYRRERDVYSRLKELGLREVHGCRIPTMTGFNDRLRVIEMTVVSRPFVLDFAEAFLDRAPEFSEEALAEWQAEKREQFGGRWSDVQIILAALAEHGIIVVDVNPNNISWDE